MPQGVLKVAAHLIQEGVGACEVDFGARETVGTQKSGPGWVLHFKVTSGLCRNERTSKGGDSQPKVGRLEEGQTMPCSSISLKFLVLCFSLSLILQKA